MSKARKNEELLSWAVELCRVVPETPGYPTWTLFMERLAGVAQSYWLDGNSRPQFSREVRIVLRLGIHDITTKILAPCGTQNRAVFWPFGKRVMELLILDKKERVAESQ